MMQTRSGAKAKRERTAKAKAETRRDDAQEPARASTSAIAGQSQLERLPPEIAERVWRLACGYGGDERSPDPEKAALCCTISKTILPYSQRLMLQSVELSLSPMRHGSSHMRHVLSLCDFLKQHRHQLTAVRTLWLDLTLIASETKFVDEYLEDLATSIGYMSNLEDFDLVVATPDGNYFCLDFDVFSPAFRSMAKLTRLKWDHDVPDHHRSCEEQYAFLSNILDELHPDARLECLEFHEHHPEGPSELSNRYPCLDTLTQLLLTGVSISGTDVMRCENLRRLDLIGVEKNVDAFLLSAPNLTHLKIGFERDGEMEEAGWRQYGELPAAVFSVLPTTLVDLEIGNCEFDPSALEQRLPALKSLSRLHLAPSDEPETPQWTALRRAAQDQVPHFELRWDEGLYEDDHPLSGEEE